MNSSDKYKCQHVETLKWSNDETVTKLLSKASRMVQPIMVRRKWKVPKLSEFYPTNPRLLGLNINRGQEIKIRCRLPSDQKSLYQIDHIVETLLHELCHIVHGPHNSNFYKLLDQLREELDEFQKKGVEGTGYGFDIEGKKLDTEKVNNLSRHEAKLAAVKAAEKRAKIRSMMGVYKLGGKKTKLSPREAAALAAEKRYKDGISCGTI